MSDSVSFIDQPLNLVNGSLSGECFIIKTVDRDTIYSMNTVVVRHKDKAEGSEFYTTWSITQIEYAVSVCATIS